MRLIGRPSSGRCPQGLQAGQVAQLQQLERRAAAGGHPVDVAGQAELGQRGGRVAAADDGERHGCRPRPGPRRGCPAAKRSSSNTPIGPFQNTVRASMTTSANAAAVPGPMSRPLPPSGSRRPHVCTLPSAARPTMSSGRWIGLGPAEQPLAGVHLVGLEQRVADRVALGGEEREAHAAADDERVHHAEQGVDHADLVADLGPAEHGDERALRGVAQAEQHLDLLGQQAAGRRSAACGAARRSRHGRGGRPRRRRRRRRPCPPTSSRHEGRVVALLTRVEPEVLQQLDARRQLGQALAHRRHRVLRVRAGPSAARGGCRPRPCAPCSCSQRDRGQRGADAEVVDDAPVLQRHVEVGADEHPLARRRGRGPPAAAGPRSV